MSHASEQDKAAFGNPAGVPPANSQLLPPLSDSPTKADTDNQNGEQDEASESNTPSETKNETQLDVPKSKHEVGWRRVVRNFSPSWFSVTMGTGIVSILFYFMPYNGRWLYWLSIIFFCLNTLLFLLALTISVLRYTLYPEIWGVMIKDPNNSLFLGTIPIGFATLIEMWLFICVPLWGEWATTLVWVCWMIDAAFSVTVTVSLSVLLVMQTHQLKSLDRFTAVQLLPIASTIVAAGVGAEIAEVLPDPQRALNTLITGYILWGAATPLAMTVLVTYFQRLAVFKLPPREIVVSCFLPLGPLGYGGYTIMYLGKVARDVFPTTNALDPMAGPVLYVVGFFLALVMWAFGLVWLVVAVASIVQARPVPFNMGWWGFTFPLGVYAASTIQIGHELGSGFFLVLGEVLSVAVILLWCLVAARTALGAWSGKLFYAPCLANLKREIEEADKVRGA